MNKDFVPYSIAVKLKERGFDSGCHYYYTKRYSDNAVVCLSSKESPTNYNKKPGVVCSMPTLWQAQKWLREKWGIHIDVCIYSDYSTDADGKVCDRWDFWGFDLYAVAGGGRIADDDGEYDSYEQALTEGIKSALELIKNGE